MIVNVDNFPRAESDLMFSRMLHDTGGLNTWLHYRVPAPVEHQPIVRQNRDTLYSVAIVDVSQGAVLTVPESGDRYLSVMVVTQDHFIPRVLHDAGDHELTAAELGTDYVLLAARVFVDPNDPDDVAAANQVQDGLALEAASATPFVMPDYDEESWTRTRAALLALSEDLPDYGGAFGPADAVDPRRHLVGSAAGWGGLPQQEAHYVNVAPGLPVGDYRLRMVDPPVDAFWSISLYDAQGYFVPNDLGAYNLNSVTAARDEDGGVTVHFGTDPKGRPNFLPVMEGWNFLIRLYRPRPEALDGRWQPPALEPA